MPPGIYKRDHLDWSSSPDEKWLLVTQRRYEPPVYVEGLLPVAQRRWLLTSSGACIGSKNPPYKPLESEPLWLKDSRGWYSTTAQELVVHDLQGTASVVCPLPLPQGKGWFHFPVANLSDGRVLVSEEKVEVSEGVSDSNPILTLRFRGAAAEPCLLTIPYSFLRGVGTTAMVPERASASTDGERVAVQYYVFTHAPGQSFWGRFIAGPEPRNQHFEVWVTALDGSEARCLYSGQEFWYGGMLWHPDGKRLLLSGDRAFVVTTER